MVGPNGWTATRSDVCGACRLAQVVLFSYEPITHHYLTGKLCDFLYPWFFYSVPEVSPPTWPCILQSSGSLPSRNGS